MHLFLTKVAVKVAFMHKHFTQRWFTQTIYLHVMLNISKHYLAIFCQQKWRSLATVCVAC